VHRARASTERVSLSADDGSASLEFIAVGLILLVPLVYLIVAVGMIQSQALGVETASRQLARTLASAPDPETGDARAERVIEAIVAEYGIDRSGLRIDVSCAAPGPCPSAGALLTVTVTAEVGLPLVPPVLGLDRAARVPVTATAVHKVSRYRVDP